MTKEELVLRITRAMYKDRRNLESFKAYQAIKGYFLDLEMADLIGIETLKVTTIFIHGSSNAKCKLFFRHAVSPN